MTDPLDAPTTLTHLDGRDHARMVEVGHKPPSRRVATAAATLQCTPAAARAMAEGVAPKGDVAAIARAAAILAAKRTPELVILAHPLPLDSVGVQIEVDAERGQVAIAATVATTAPTGVEMEALAAVSAAALNIYDMLKGLDPGQRIEGIHLVSKHTSPCAVDR